MPFHHPDLLYDMVVAQHAERQEQAKSVQAYNAFFATWLAPGIRRRWLERIIRCTFAIWRQRFPRWVNSGFDEYFLLHDALPLLNDILLGAQHPDPTQLARKWVMAYGIPVPRVQRAVAEVVPVAADFLALLQRTTSGSREARWILVTD